MSLKKVAQENVEHDKDAPLTQKQLLDICVEINKKKPAEVIEKTKVFVETTFGRICLN